MSHMNELKITVMGPGTRLSLPARLGLRPFLEIDISILHISRFESSSYFSGKRNTWAEYHFPTPPADACRCESENCWSQSSQSV